MTNKMQIIYLFICTQSAIHVSGDVFARNMYSWLGTNT